MKGKIFDWIFMVAIIFLLICTVIFGILGEIIMAMFCFILAIDCIILGVLVDLIREVESK